MSSKNEDFYECFDCGFLVDYEDNFCSNCGVQLIEKESVVVEEDGVYFLEKLKD